MNVVAVEEIALDLRPETQLLERRRRSCSDGGDAAAQTEETLRHCCSDGGDAATHLLGWRRRDAARSERRRRDRTEETRSEVGMEETRLEVGDAIEDRGEGDAAATLSIFSLVSE
ncbi:hypothetical protein SESBI_13542 [Sesbania bispinosa]|nr:hypothetical protein SESBI_13542 [Sesbania bispinosa]